MFDYDWLKTPPIFVFHILQPEPLALYLSTKLSALQLLKMLKWRLFRFESSELFFGILCENSAEIELLAEYIL